MLELMALSSRASLLRSPCDSVSSEVRSFAALVVSGTPASLSVTAILRWHYSGPRPSHRPGLITTGYVKGDVELI